MACTSLVVLLLRSCFQLREREEGQVQFDARDEGVIDVGAGIILIDNHLHITIAVSCCFHTSQRAEDECAEISVMGLQAFNSVECGMETLRELRKALCHRYNASAIIWP